MRLFVKHKSKLILIVFWQFTYYSSFSQTTNAPQVFKVISLPKSSGYSIVTLNSEISNAASKDAVIRIIKKHGQLVNVPIVIKIKKSPAQIVWWRLNTSQLQNQKEGDFTVFQSKATEAGRFYKRREVQQYFKDTIVVFDTLKLGMYLQDADFRIENYFLRIHQKDNSRDIAVPYDKRNNLLLMDSLFTKKLWVRGDLYNREDTSDAVCIMNLYFPDEQVKASLIDIARDLKTDIPDIDSKDLAGFISGYIKSNFGSVSFRDVVDFLQKNIQ